MCNSPSSHRVIALALSSAMLLSWDDDRQDDDVLNQRSVGEKECVFYA